MERNLKETGAIRTQTQPRSKQDRTLIDLVVTSLEDDKAQSITVIDLTGKSTIADFMADLKGRGLVYLDGRESAASVAQRTAAQAGVPAAQADLVVDLDLGRASVLKQLKLAESLARANGSVIAIGRPYPVTLERIRIWLRELAENGLALTPLSGVITERLSG